MSTEKMREEFSKWYDEERKKSAPFPTVDIRATCFEAWKASRAAIEVQAPDDGIEDCQEQWGEQCKNTFDCGYNFASMRYDQAIESLGLKVKP